MSFVYHFSPNAMNRDKYDACIARLAEAGASNPRGRQYHVCYGPPDALRVFDIWESDESFQEFGQTLMPILQELGVDPGNPEVAAVHKVIVG
jgi:hypothetical protein